MKKLLSVLLALVLMLGCASVFAEATPAESNLETFEFDGFTMTFDADMAGEIYDKAENQVYFQLFPFYDENAAFNSNINCVWNPAVEDLTKIDANVFAAAVMQAMPAQYETMGLKVENAKVLLAQPTSRTASTRSPIWRSTTSKAHPVHDAAVVSDAAFGTL